ncbi:MAG: acylphosphatase [Sphingomonas bacterium]|jgi:acylphosphatase|uniref:acylphosphatase n=1 Tax=Sphingomonas bacterium TaxID=1895847 RepID=UPI00261C7801|nr:acylphosphatase [Sphingomonas bacterium]MDB5705717.1 acylphosphatase [Sphingomonas bacterium]
MSSLTPSTTQRVFISGKVQGVGFRDWVVRHAKAFGLIGWVRNRSDGRIEILIIGDSEASTALIDKCREGPQLARVDHIEAHADSERPPKGFTKRFTL